MAVACKGGASIGRAVVEHDFAEKLVDNWSTDRARPAVEHVSSMSSQKCRSKLGRPSAGGQRSSRCRAIFRGEVGRHLVDRFGRPAVDQVSTNISAEQLVDSWSTDSGGRRSSRSRALFRRDVGRHLVDRARAAIGRAGVEHYFAEKLVDTWSTDRARPEVEQVSSMISRKCWSTVGRPTARGPRSSRRRA